MRIGIFGGRREKLSLNTELLSHEQLVTNWAQILEGHLVALQLSFPSCIPIDIVHK